MGTINSLVIGTIMYLAVLNVFLFVMGSTYYDSGNAPRFVETSGSIKDGNSGDCVTKGGECKVFDACDTPDEWDFDATGCSGLSYCCVRGGENKQGGIGILRSVTFGYFINVNSIPEKSVRFVLRTILTIIFQLIGMLILIFALLDYFRGIG